MKAVLCKQYGPPESLVVEEITSKPLGKGEVRVALHAAGVNFPDVLIIQGKYQFKPEMPFSPGGEAAGEVTEVGEGVTGYKPGDRVIVMCGWGGFADELVIGQDRIIKMPPSMDYATGAAFLMTYGTSHHALKQRAQIKPGETLLVLGAAGGVGLAAVELGKVMGARVIAAASTDEKLELCKKYGADEVINYSREKIRDRVKELTGGKGADVIYDPVGGDAFDEAIRCINWEGRLLVIGFASGRIPQLPANLALLKGCQIVGVFWGDFTRREPELHRENLAEMMRWFEEGKLHPHISATYRMDQAADALNDMMNRKVQGKAVLLTR
jgi:NADPH2:quinone reductase